MLVRLWLTYPTISGALCFRQTSALLNSPLRSSSSLPFCAVGHSPAPHLGLGSKHASTMTSATSLYDFKPLDKKGEPYPTDELKGKVVLIVNTASKCGYTPQFKGLEELYQEIKTSPKGADFEILGFPCNQFLNQDPGSNEEIQSFCQVNYGVTFPVLGKTNVNGDKAEPLYEWMKKEKPGLMGMKRIKWNFEKFLIGKDGKVKGRWASGTKPKDLKAAIEQELGKEGKSEL